jgi:hypothetical protein
MNIREALDNLDTSESNLSDVDIDAFIRALDYQEHNWNDYCISHDAFETRVKAYWITKWYCTDSWVGIRAYMLDGEPVAVSYQQGRKWDVAVSFLSDAAAKNIREFVDRIIKEDDEKNKYDISIVDMDAEIGLGWFEHD